jgi:hypothetical protein
MSGPAMKIMGIAIAWNNVIGIRYSACEKPLDVRPFAMNKLIFQ